MKGILGDCSDIPENLAEPTLTLTARGAFDAGVVDCDVEAPEFTQRRRDRGPDSRFREADVALRATNTPPDHLIGRQVGVLRYAVYGVRGLAAAGAPSATLPWLGYDDRIAHLSIAQWQRTQVSDARPRVRFNSLAPMLQATADGLRIAALPLFAADRYQSLSRLTRVLDQPRKKLWVLCHNDMRENARVRALWQHLAKSLPHVLASRRSLIHP